MNPGPLDPYMTALTTAPQNMVQLFSVRSSVPPFSADPTRRGHGSAGRAADGPPGGRGSVPGLLDQGGEEVEEADQQQRRVSGQAGQASMGKISLEEEGGESLHSTEVPFLLLTQLHLV